MGISVGVLMNSTFWTNTIWYVLLGISTIIELVITLYITNRRRLTLAVYITTVGMTLYLETMILIFFRAYEYYPMILHKSIDQYNDVLVGNLFSQFSVSATVLLVVILDLKYYWSFISGIIYGIIEESFIALGVFSHNWYRTWMTVIGLPIIIWMVKKMYSKVLHGIKPLTYYGFIYAGLFTLYVVTLLWGLDVAGVMRFSDTLFENARVSRYGLYLVYYTLASTFLICFYFLELKLRYRFLLVIVLYALFYSGYRLHMIWVKEGWFFAVTTLSILWAYLSIYSLDKLYGGHKQNIKKDVCLKN